MIKAEQVPDEVLIAFCSASEDGATVVEAIAAALNAWPNNKLAMNIVAEAYRAEHEDDHSFVADSIILPLGEQS